MGYFNYFFILSRKFTPGSNPVLAVCSLSAAACCSAAFLSSLAFFYASFLSVLVADLSARLALFN
jgi:hypothetical protein